MTNAIMVCCQLIGSDWLNANKKTGNKKKEKGNLRCLNVLFWKIDEGYIFFIIKDKGKK